eukprot:Nk52_evm41s1485 gene=Nk52_evmTU41s1485
MNDNKLDLIQNMPVAKDRRGVRRILGVTGFYRRFVQHYCTITAPIADLLKEDQPFKWTDRQDKAFDELKAAIAKNITLAIPDFSKPFVIHFDASNVGCGAGLFQENDEGKLVPISFISRKFIPAERNYSITERELLSIVFAVTKWRHYLHLNKFKVLTDHKALTYFDNLHSLTGKLARWQLILQSYDYELLFIKGEDNILADYWSREGVETLSEEQIRQDLQKHRGDEDDFFDRFCCLMQESRMSRPDNFEQWIWYAHNFGHFGPDITYRRLRMIHNWPGMERDVQQLLKG